MKQRKYRHSFRFVVVVIFVVLIVYRCVGGWAIDIDPTSISRSTVRLLLFSRFRFETMSIFRCVLVGDPQQLSPFVRVRFRFVTLILWHFLSLFCSRMLRNSVTIDRCSSDFRFCYMKNYYLLLSLSILNCNIEANDDDERAKWWRWRSRRARECSVVARAIVDAISNASFDSRFSFAGSFVFVVVRFDSFF